MVKADRSVSIGVDDIEEWSSLPSPDKIKFKVLISPDTVGSKLLLLGVAELNPGGEHISHYHDVEEAFYVVKGESSITVGEKTIKAKPGMAVYCPPNTKHSIVNDGKETLILCFAFSTPNPKSFR